MDNTSNTMRAAIKALTDVVTPAVDSTDHAQAKEQVRLVTDFLTFAEQRLELIGDREDAQLRAAVALAGALQAVDGVGGLASARPLASAREAAVTAFTERSGGSAARRLATAELEVAIRLVVLEAAETADERCRQVESAVIAATKKQIEADRAWLLPLGFDPAPDTLPPVAATLGA